VQVQKGTELAPEVWTGARVTSCVTVCHFYYYSFLYSIILYLYFEFWAIAVTTSHTSPSHFVSSTSTTSTDGLRWAGIWGMWSLWYVFNLFFLFFLFVTRLSMLRWNSRSIVNDPVCSRLTSHVLPVSHHRATSFLLLPQRAPHQHKREMGRSLRHVSTRSSLVRFSPFFLWRASWCYVETVKALSMTPYVHEWRAEFCQSLKIFEHTRKVGIRIIKTIILWD
jgi:hypothetical protein